MGPTTFHHEGTPFSLPLYPPFTTTRLYMYFGESPTSIMRPYAQPLEADVKATARCEGRQAE